MSADPQRQRGVVLVMVLAILAIAGTVLAASVSLSCRRAVAALQAQRDLQVRWGNRSVHAVIMPQAEAILAKQEEQLKRPTAKVVRRFSLAGLEHELVICDEQAKANVNQVMRTRGDSAVAVVQDLLMGQGQVIFTPGVGDEDDVISYDQVLAYSRPSELLGEGDSRDGMVANITCWGSGKVNFRRADIRVLRAVAAEVLNETHLARLKELLNRQPEAGLDQALKHLELSEEQAAKAANILTDRSSCHALWLTITDSTRSWRRMYVSQSADGETRGGEYMFQW